MFRHAQSDAVRSTCQVVVRMQYFGQLNDLVPSPVARIESRADVAALVDAFEELYAKVYVRSARSPELGFMFTSAISLGAVDVEKPKLPTNPETPEVSADAHKGTRRLYWRGDWVTAELYEMDCVRSGNVIEGPAVIEDPATTFVVPPDSVARLDTHRIFHLSTRTAARAVAADAEYATA